MAGGKFHSKVTLALTVPVGVGTTLASLLWTDPMMAMQAGVLASTGCFSGIFLTPDLDQEGISYSEGIIIRSTFGLGFIWLLLWGPYAVLIPHRSPLSHWPIVGTVGRLGYLYLIATLLLFLFHQPPPAIPFNVVLPYFFGLVISDTAHWIVDVLSTAAKRKIRQQRTPLFHSQK